MRMPRRVEPEILDQLPQADARAIRSRRDLHRINRAMASQSILCRGIHAATRGRPPRRIIEFGAGDGRLLLGLGRRHATKWRHVEATVVDRHDLISRETRQGFASLGWTLRVVAHDALDWVEATEPVRYDLSLANLFLHHFSGAALSGLLAGIAARSSVFVASEPRRGAAALLGSHLVGLLGCNAVSRNDAVSSVHAGFRDGELSAAWPAAGSWQLEEYPAGLFSHCFLATRRDAYPARAS